MLSIVLMSGFLEAVIDSGVTPDCVSPACEQSGSVPDAFEKSVRIPDTVPQKVYAPAAHRGKVETFYYHTIDSNGKSLKKRAQVYIPYSYDSNDRSAHYNVVYLIHGGGDNSTSFFTDPRSPLSLSDVLDHLIEDGLLKPLIVVTPTFYPDDSNIGKNGMSDAIAMTRDFHKELRRDLIPAVETAYNTWLESPDSISVTRSRLHRAFGGFSMGALSTWYQLAYDNDAVGHYLPLSGDLWTFDGAGKRESAEASASWLEGRLKASTFSDDFQIYAFTGTDDIAGEPEKNLIRVLVSQSSLFRQNGGDANIVFYVKPGGRHYYGDINAYLYQALPLVRF